MAISVFQPRENTQSRDLIALMLQLKGMRQKDAQVKESQRLQEAYQGIFSRQVDAQTAATDLKAERDFIEAGLKGSRKRLIDAQTANQIRENKVWGEHPEAWLQIQQNKASSRSISDALVLSRERTALLKEEAIQMQNAFGQATDQFKAKSLEQQAIIAQISGDAAKSNQAFRTSLSQITANYSELSDMFEGDPFAMDAIADFTKLNPGATPQEQIRVGTAAQESRRVSLEEEETGREEQSKAFVHFLKNLEPGDLDKILGPGARKDLLQQSIEKILGRSVEEIENKPSVVDHILSILANFKLAETTTTFETVRDSKNLDPLNILGE